MRPRRLRHGAPRLRARPARGGPRHGGTDARQGGCPMTERNTGDSIVADIAAPPDRVYDLISDITRMPEWSPECIHCEWTDGATGPSVGARFKARNKGGRGPAWSNKPEVTVADPGREFAFNRQGFAIGSYTWRYRLEPTA